MSRREDMTGQRFGRLVVIRFSHINKNGGQCWLCLCDCGTEVTVGRGHLLDGCTSSCKCLMRERAANLHRTHGMTGTPIFGVWMGMRSRCLIPSDASYYKYGARGITVCERWLKFENFYADMGEVPKGMSIDRIDNNGNYEPSNCRWATLIEQARNRRNNILVTFDGKTQCLSAWSEELGISLALLWIRHKKGQRPPDLFKKARKHTKATPVTPERVRAMRALYAQGGVIFRDLGKEFGLHENTVGRIIRGQMWGHVSGGADVGRSWIEAIEAEKARVGDTQQ